jgi:hypothetical protein
VARSVAVIGGLALAVALILAGSLGLRAARDQLATDRTSAGAPQAIPSGDEARYHELAERLLNFGYGPTGSTSITLLPGALPTDPQVTLPNVNGARLVGTAVRVRGTDRTADIVLDAPGDPQQVANAYEQGFKELGWSGPPTGIGPSTGGGFQASVPPVSRFLCKGESTFVSISVAARSGLPDDVRISVQPTVTSYGGVGPCSAQARGPSAGSSNHLPLLRPPDGATLLGSGGGISSSIGGGAGNVNRQSSEASATTSMSSGELEAALAKQLAAAGWTRVAGRDDGALAWSTWTSNESGWSGSLIVNDTSTKDRHALLLRAEGPGN